MSESTATLRLKWTPRGDKASNAFNEPFRLHVAQTFASPEKWIAEATDEDGEDGEWIRRDLPSEIDAKLAAEEYAAERGGGKEDFAPCAACDCPLYAHLTYDRTPRSCCFAHEDGSNCGGFVAVTDGAGKAGG